MKRSFPSSSNGNTTNVVRGCMKIFNPVESKEIDDDYRYAKVCEVEGQQLRGVKVPFGARRIKYAYTYTQHHWVNSFPVLSRLSAFPLTPGMLVGKEMEYTYSLPAGVWHFSVASIFLQTEATEAFLKYKDYELYSQYCELIENVNNAISTFNRDALAPIYAHLFKIMSSYFRMSMRVLSTLDLRHLFVYLAKLYTEGIHIALTPHYIPLWKQLTKKIIHKHVPEEADVPVVSLDDPTTEDEDAVLAAVRDYDDDIGIDSNRALYENDTALSETLHLCTLPKITEKTNVGPLVVRNIVMASKRPDEISLPLLPVSDIESRDWIAFAVLKVVESAFNKDHEYYCTLAMLIEGLKAYDARASKGTFPAKVVKGQLPAILTCIADSPRSMIVITKGGVPIKKISDLDIENGDQLGINDNSPNVIRLFLRMAFEQEQQIINNIGLIVAKPPTPSKPYIQPSGGPRLSPEQTRAVVHAITKPFTLITGRGGTGKTAVMKEIYAELRRKYGDGAQFLFVAFTNRMVAKLAAMFNCKVADSGNSAMIFRTCDSVIFSLTRHEYLKPLVIIMDESTQNSGAHIQGILRAIDLRYLRHLIMLGDHRQRGSIGQGTPFRHFIDMYPQHVCHLTTVHRTGCVELLNRQVALLAGNAAAVLAPSTDPSFAYIEVKDTRGRMFTEIMTSYTCAIFEALREVDPAAEKYSSIMLICPYNDYCGVAGAMVAKYYFDRELDLASVLADIAAKKKEPPVFYLGMRAVFKGKRKEEEDGVYSHGQIGEVICIRKFVNGRWDSHVKIAAEKSPESLKSTKELGVGGGSVYIRMIDTKEVVRIGTHGGLGLASQISQGNCVTVDSVQGWEFDNVITVLPPGRHLADQGVVYVAVSRAVLSLTMIGPKAHITKMIETLPERKNSIMTDHYKKEEFKAIMQ